MNELMRIVHCLILKHGHSQFQILFYKENKYFEIFPFEVRSSHSKTVLFIEAEVPEMEKLVSELISWLSSFIFSWFILALDASVHGWIKDTRILITMLELFS